MGTAAHTGGAWLVGYNKDLPLRDLGATIVSQSITFPGAGTGTNYTIGRIPAGTRIDNVTWYIQAGATAVGAGSVNVTFTPDGGTGVTIGVLGVPAVAANAFGSASWTPNSQVFNIGTVGGTLTLNTGIATGTNNQINVNYVVRNRDGTITRVA